MANLNIPFMVAQQDDTSICANCDESFFVEKFPPRALPEYCTDHTKHYKNSVCLANEGQMIIAEHD